ncbi:MAG: hypothetical protein ACJAQ6_000251 [Arenicella sp.]|jgi:hypothetical protein
MVNLFFEIKRNIPPHQQSSMKISDPELGKVMSALYRQTDDQNIKLLTKIFLERAGQTWLKDADKSASSIATRPTKIVKPLVVNKQADTPEPIKKPKSKRIYRGQVVED